MSLSLLSNASLSAVLPLLLLVVMTPAVGSDAVASEPRSGVVKGAVTYPSEVLPADLEVCAHPEGRERPLVCTRNFVADKGSASGVGYRLELPQGRYQVFARTSQLPNVRAYALTTRRNGSEVPLPVTVRSGEVTHGVDAAGWYTRV